MPSPQAQTEASSGRFLTKLTVISTLGGLLFGYDTGVISGALLYMKDDLAYVVRRGHGRQLAAVPGRRLRRAARWTVADALGRKRSSCCCARSVPRSAPWVAHWHPTWRSWSLARIVLGLGVGAAAVTVPAVPGRDGAGRSPRADGDHQRADDRDRPDARLRDQRAARPPHTRTRRVAHHARDRRGARRPADASACSSCPDSPRWYASRAGSARPAGSSSLSRRRVGGRTPSTPVDRRARPRT